jgi:hypothetical protein
MKIGLALLLCLVSSFVQAEIWRFGLIGDVPYSEYERQELPKMIGAMADQQVDFIAHIGDFKHGKERCDDSLFANRHQMFNASRVPLVYVPGDNEWTDCDRLSNGGYDPLERLNKLRSLFWKDSFSLGQKKLKLTQQPGNYPEHARFQLGPVLFVTLNMPGSSNNFGIADTPRQEYLARNPVVLKWLKDSFFLAREQKLAGVVLLFQANPGFKHFAQGLTHGGFRDIFNMLDAELKTFSGQVVVVHGDTHISRIDHPLRDADGHRITRFTRVETFGYPTMGWTRGIIDSEAEQLFRFEAQAWPPKTH